MARGAGPAPRALSAVPGLDRQIREQDELASSCGIGSHEDGALDLDRVEAQFTVPAGRRRRHGGDRTYSRARSDRTLHGRGQWRNRALLVRSRLSVHPPRRSHAQALGSDRRGRGAATAPGSPRRPTCSRFNSSSRSVVSPRRRDFSELSLTIIKLLGSGEYAARAAGADPEPHFALAAQAYTHATAPNRRFPDLITQRLLKAALAGRPTPYSLDELTALAEHCTRQEDAANKVERLVRKAAAALWIGQRIGDVFDAVVTGAGPKGTWVRLASPPIEGKLERGFEGLDVGDRVRVRLIDTDPDRGFIDFARA